MKPGAWTLGPVVVWTAAAAMAAARPPETDPTAFFETKIRPVLVTHCYSCHSTQAPKVKGGLLLDTRAGIRKGGDSGPAVVPGQLDQSLLLTALRYEGPQMPPKGQLPAAVIADFEKWVALGAPDPRAAAVAGSKSPPIDFDAARRHWAYQSIRPPALPSVRHTDWPRSALDTLVLARLEAHRLSPSPPADRRTLIRRAYYDLIGLPPTYPEVEAFVHDPAPDAFARVVERLLASPHYGERWGRHWLDVARYADTKDLVLLFGDDRVRPYAYTYRDYVVRALNADVPYDQFLHEQLAADRIEPKVEPWKLAALGFLTLGRMFDNNPHDIYDDQIDTVTRGLLGLTVACARCHDHKYDAIPTADYYSLYGVFANSEVPIDLPLTDDPRKTPGSAEFENKAAPKRKALQEFIDTQYQQITETARMRVTDYLLKIATEKPDPLENAVFFLSLSPEDLKPGILSQWRQYLDKHARADDPVFGPWHDLMQLPDSRFAPDAPGIVARWLSTPAGVSRGQVNPLVQRALATAILASRADVARLYGELLLRVYRTSQQLQETKDPTPSLAAQQLLEMLTGIAGPIHFPRSNAYLHMARVERSTYGNKLQELDKLAVQSLGAPSRAMILIDSPQPYQPRIFVRGNPSQPGERVPRQFLRILAGEDRRPFGSGSGRLDLARAVTAPENPLTSRVIVNRVWMHHFGEPLVSSPSDFGTRSSPPSHPELLDYLAWSFQQEGWSLKKLHRQLLLSRTYQQASLDRPECRQVDPENRWLWRAHRRRLDLEAMRDSLLALSGRLEYRLGGRPVDVVGDPQNRRRTLYGKVDRQDLPGLYRVFDFSNPDQTVERRPQTTVPQQALFAMNAPFMIEQAKALAARPEVAGEPRADRRVAALHRLVLARSPDPAEVQLALRFLEMAATEQGPSQLTPWQQYAQVLLLTNELMFLD